MLKPMSRGNQKQVRDRQTGMYRLSIIIIIIIVIHFVLWERLVENSIDRSYDRYEYD